MQKILCALFIASTIVYAGGAASLVGKKSSSKGYSYDPLVEMRFINDCAEDANRLVCKCVLEKIKGQYSEKDYLKIDSDLTKNISRPDFVKFVAKAAKSCDAEIAPSTFDKDQEYIADTQDEEQPLTEEEIRESIQNHLKDLSKKDFIDDFSQKVKTMIGEKASKKIASCFYDLVANDQDRIVKRIVENPSADKRKLVADVVSDCLPQNFTPDIKKNLSNFFNQDGLPLSISKCIVDKFEKEFTFKNFFLSVVNNSESIESTFNTFGAECSIGR